MAFVPDEAVDRMNEISGAAFRLFVYFCRRRNARTGICFPSLKTASEDCGLAYAYTSLMRTELVNKGWISITKDGKITPILGFKTPQSDKEINSASLENRKVESEVVLENLNGVLENRNNVLENRKPLIKDINQQSNQQNKPKKSMARQRATPTRGTRLPEPFMLTKEMRDWAVDKVPNVDVRYETEKFVNYFRSVSGQRGVKLDWVATWRNWLYKAGEQTNGKNNARPVAKGNREKLAEYEQLFERFED